MARLKQIWLTVKLWVKSIGFTKYLPLAWVYVRIRDRYERHYSPQTVAEPVTEPGGLLSVEESDRGAHFFFEQAEVEICFLAPDLVRVNWFPGLQPIPYAIDKHEWQSVATTLKQASDGWTIATDRMSVRVTSAGDLAIYDADGQILRSERPPQRQGDQWTAIAPLRAEERVYGLGERATTLNLRQATDSARWPRTYQMWNYDPAGQYGEGQDPLYMCIPVYIALHELGSYLVFYENTFLAKFSFGDEAIAHFEGGALRYYVSVGDPAHLLQRYTELTGRSPLPPKWALGYHQSRWGYQREKNVRREARLFKEHNLPLSAIHLDIDCQVSNRAFTIDPQGFPKLREFTRELAELGVRFITINNPGISLSRKNNLFLEGQILDAFCTYPNGELVVAPVWPGWTVFPDFTHPQVRAWWSRQYAYLLDVGVAGFWHDMNEPAVFATKGDHSLPKIARHHMEGRGGDHREAHNVYGLLEAEAAFCSLREYRPEQRPFIVSRSGWAGLQRYAWTWTGDTMCTWAVLRQTISTVVGLGLSGVPCSGPDIGGFQGNPSAELYLRWFQMATFMVFYRTHSSNSVEPRAPWTFGEPYLSIIRQFLELRYRLMPYIYTLLWETNQTGCPPVRPVFWADPGDRSLWEIEDAFLFGDALLVCPIVQEKQQRRSVTLPQGDWYDFWTDEAIAGHQTIEMTSSLEHIPLLVKAGTVLPMEQEGQLVLHLYPPCEGEAHSTLYSDAGDGYGDGRLDRFRLERLPDGFVLTHTDEGHYPAYATMRICLHGFELEQVWVDDQQVSHDGSTLQCDRFTTIRFQGHVAKSL